MSWSICTKEVILSLIDDVELISLEMLENCVAPKPKVYIIFVVIFIFYFHCSKVYKFSRDTVFSKNKD